MEAPRVGPGGHLGDRSELLEKAAQDPLSVSVSAQPINLSHDKGKRSLQLADGVFRVALALLIETALTFLELFEVESRQTAQVLLAPRARVRQRTTHPVP